MLQLLLPQAMVLKRNGFKYSVVLGSNLIIIQLTDLYSFLSRYQYYLYKLRPILIF
jgi:hypothetical protein